jgi:ABC-2 type transport system ATP-binding protein
VLILDEPSNGLDPAGMREVRLLLRTLGDEGVSVLLSSHLLGEVQQVCDTVTIINRGQVVAAGSVADVLAARSSAAIAIGVTGPDAAAAALAAAGYTVRLEEGRLYVEDVSDGSEVVRCLADQQIYPSWVTPVQVDLEQAFLELTGEES